MIPRLTVVLRHNTVMPGDADLARREWASLIKATGTLLDQAAFAELHTFGSKAIFPKTATSYDWVAETWTDVPLANAINLIRRSAFAQEVLFLGERAIVADLQKAVGSPVCIAESFDPNLVIALAHYYIIETEAVLPPHIDERRIATVVGALLEPYLGDRESVLARRLRGAKKNNAVPIPRSTHLQSQIFSSYGSCLNQYLWPRGCGL